MSNEIVGGVDHLVVCGVCGRDINYSVMLDAINVRPCVNLCVGSVFIGRAAVEECIKDMNGKLDAIMAESKNYGQ